MRSIKIVLIFVLFAGLAFAAEKEKKVYTAAVDKDGVQRVNIIAGSYFFDPNYIILKAKVPAELTVKKEAGAAPHTIVIKAADAGIDVSESLSTDPKTIKFTPTKAGKYPFYCDKRLLFFKSHRDRGMEGTIEVTE